jgi:WD40 repeat protein
MLISPNGENVYTSGCERAVKMWSIKDQSYMKSFGGNLINKKPIKCICLCPNGVYLFSGGEERALRQWNLEKNKLSKAYYGACENDTIACMAMAGIEDPEYREEGESNI